jgi:hypothetical protein
LARGRQILTLRSTPQDHPAPLDRADRWKPAGNSSQLGSRAFTGRHCGVQKRSHPLRYKRLRQFTSMKNLYHSLLLLIAGFTRKELAVQSLVAAINIQITQKGIST